MTSSGQLGASVLAMCVLLACGRSELGLGDDGDSVAGTDAPGRAGASGSPSGIAGRSNGGGTGGSMPNRGSGGAQSGGMGGPGAAAGMSSGGVTHVPLIGTDEPPAPICDPAGTPDLDGAAATPTSNDAEMGVAIDVNHDGKLDLLTGNEQATVSVYIGRGDGSFASSAVYTAGLEPTDAAPVTTLSVGDLDADGNVDVLLAARAGTELSILLGTKDGAFGNPIRFSATAPILHTALYDVDEDGALDLLIATLDDHGTAVSVLHGSGDGTFGDPHELWTGQLFSALRVADLNGDEHPDLVVYDGDLTVRLGVGGGDFDASETYTAKGGSSSDIEIDDFNRDGKLDLVVLAGCGRSVPSGILEFLGNGDGTFGAMHEIDPSSCPRASIYGDLNGDGNLDVVIGPAESILGHGDGTFGYATSSSVTLYGARALALGDFDRDGIPDLASANPGSVSVQHGNGDGTFGSVNDVAGTYDVQALALADLDGDGALDVTVVGELVRMLFGSGTGSFADSRDLGPGGGAHAQGFALGDLDGNGLRDLVIGLPEARSADAFRAFGSRAFGAAQPFTVDGAPQATFVGDVTTDAIPDIVTLNRDGSPLSVLAGRGMGEFGAPTHGMLAAQPTDGLLIDVNGDGKLDIVSVDQGQSIVGVLPGHGDGTFWPEADYDDASSPSHVVAGDLDGDSLPELVTAGKTTISVFMNGGDGTLTARHDYAYGATALALADFNLDGKLDLLISSPGLEILLGKGDGSFSCAEAYAPTASLSAIAVGDLNGDARPDVVTSSIGQGSLSIFLNRSR